MDAVATYGDGVGAAAVVNLDSTVRMIRAAEDDETATKNLALILDHVAVTEREVARKKMEQLHDAEVQLQGERDAAQTRAGNAVRELEMVTLMRSRSVEHWMHRKFEHQERAVKLRDALDEAAKALDRIRTEWDNEELLEVSGDAYEAAIDALKDATDLKGPPSMADATRVEHMERLLGEIRKGLDPADEMGLALSPTYEGGLAFIRDATPDAAKTIREAVDKSLEALQNDDAICAWAREHSEQTEPETADDEVAESGTDGDTPP